MPAPFMKHRTPWAVVLVALLSGCAAGPSPYRTPDHWQKTGYSWPSAARKSPAPASRENGTMASPRLSNTLSVNEDTSASVNPLPSDVVFGRQCLAELQKQGVRFRRLSSLKGVETPVEIQGKLGSVDFWANDGRALRMDCRLALTLARLRPVFERAGVTRIRYSGAYSYRTTRTGRLSHHAHGLAIDLHDFEFGRREVTVKKDFATNKKCRGRLSALNELSCELASSGVFREFLTPDYNSDHRDHLHLAVPRRDQLTR